MKSNSTKTLMQFVFCIVAVITIQITNAQIVYTDVNPDAASSGTYNLDLNNDGTIDFVIQYTSKTVKGSGNCNGQSATNHYMKVTPLNNNQVLDAGTSARKNAGTYARKMASSQTIDAHVKSWSSNVAQVMFSSEYSCAYYCFYGGCGYYFWPTNNGEWSSDTNDGFLGLRLISGRQTFYGWVRINIQTGVFTVKDYAYNGSASQAILAGQSSTEYLGISTIENPLCAGNNLTIPYIIAGTFSPSNVVTAELSDAEGSFASPVGIGNVTSNVSGNINAVIPALTSSGTAYRIRVRSSNPARISNPNSYDLTVSGGGLPNGTITPSQYNSSNICDDDVSLHATYYEGPCYSYQWQLNGNNISGATNNNYSPISGGNYTCIITNGVGSVTSNTITLTADPVPAIINASGENTVCGGPVYLYNSGRSGTYQWKLNGNDIPNATYYDFYAYAAGAYSCVKTTDCGTATSNIISVSINPPMADAVITAAGPTAICSGVVVLNANAGSGLTYQWLDVGYPYDAFNPKIISGALSSSYAATATGVYKVIETNSVGCSKESNYIVALVGNPQPSIYPSSDAACQVSPFNVNLHAEPSQYISPANAYSYQWIKDGANISNATAQDYAAQKTGIYSVRVTLNSGGCSGISAGVQITSCSGNTKASSNSYEKEPSALTEDFHTLTITPNPVNTSATISFTVVKQGKLSLAVYDMAGKLVKKFRDKEYNEGTYQVSLNTNDMRNGIYLLRMELGGILQIRKFIVMK